jgi:cytochrome bd-type quinol oxidase subunit 2
MRYNSVQTVGLVPIRQQIARVLCYSALALTVAFAVSFALSMLGSLGYEALRAAMDAPTALAFWAYTVLTPFLSALALWLGQEDRRLMLTVKVLAALWLAIFLFLFFMPLLKA